MKMIWLKTAIVAVASLSATTLSAQTSPGYTSPFAMERAQPYVSQMTQPYYTGLPESRVNVSFGIAAIQKKDYARAQRIFMRAANGSHNPEIHFLAGVASAGNEKLKLARDYFSRAVALDRSHFNAYAALALTNVRMGDQAAAREVLDDLRARQKACNSECSVARPLDQTVTLVERWVS